MHASVKTASALGLHRQPRLGALLACRNVHYRAFVHRLLAGAALLGVGAVSWYMYQNKTLPGRAVG